jgi:hypothetical protein
MGCLLPKPNNKQPLLSLEADSDKCPKVIERGERLDRLDFKWDDSLRRWVPINAQNSDDPLWIKWTANWPPPWKPPVARLDSREIQ